MRSDVYLMGYYGMKNQGDNALMHAAYWGAQHFLNAQQISISCPESIHSLQIHSDPTLVGQQSFIGQNRLLHYYQGLQSKQILIGGGSVFHTAQDINIKRHLMGLCQEKTARAVGVSLGPFVDSAAEKSCQKFLNDAEFVGVRDVHSLNVANHLAPNANVKLTFDLAPLLLMQHEKCLPLQLNASAEDKHGIGVCLNPVERLTGDLTTELERIDAIAAALIRVFKETGETIKIIDFNGHKKFGDAQVHRYLIEKLKGKVLLEYYAYQDNPFETLEVLSSLKLTLAMRLHASIFSYLVDTPFISLNYHPKCKGWCDQIGQDESMSLSLDTLDAQFLSDRLLKQLNQPFDLPKLNKRDAVTLSLANWSNDYECH